MRTSLPLLCLPSLAALSLVPALASCAEVDARPPDRLTLTGSHSTYSGSDNTGNTGALNYLHYFTPDAIFGLGGEHQIVEDATLTFGSLRAGLGRGESGSRFNLMAEVNYGEGDDNGRHFDYGIAVLGISQAFTPHFSVQLETRQIDIDRSNGNLPKLGLTYLWTPRLATNVSYARSVGGNLGTELYSGRVDYYGTFANLLAGGASGTANPAVLVLTPGITLPASHSKQGFVGISKIFSRGEVQLLGDYLEVSGSERITFTLSFTTYLGSRGRPQ